MTEEEKDKCVKLKEHLVNESIKFGELYNIPPSLQAYTVVIMGKMLADLFKEKADAH